MKPDVTVIVVSYRPATARSSACAALAAPPESPGLDPVTFFFFFFFFFFFWSLGPVAYEVIVVDNASTDGSADAVPRRPARAVRVKRDARPTSASAAP